MLEAVWGAREPRAAGRERAARQAEWRSWRARGKAAG